MLTLEAVTAFSGIGMGYGEEGYGEVGLRQ